VIDTLTPHWSIPPLNNWDIWMFTQTNICIFTWLCQCHLKLERTKRPSSFYLGNLSSSKNFNHIVKVARIFHRKLGDNYRPSYFPTSTPLRHTSYHHNRLIASDQFLTWKNTTNLLHAINFWHGYISTPSLS
jgi:hypothetical protein